jgi:hypothetical protein
MPSLQALPGSTDVVSSAVSGGVAARRLAAEIGGERSAVRAAAMRAAADTGLFGSVCRAKTTEVEKWVAGSGGMRLLCDLYCLSVVNAVRLADCRANAH